MKILTIVLLSVLSAAPSTAQWVQTSGPAGGSATHFSVDPSNGYIFALANGGIYRSTDEGASWVLVTNNLPADLGPTALTASGSNLYIGFFTATSSKVIYRSTDNGDTWTLATCTGIPASHYPSAMTTVGPKLIIFAYYLLGGGKMYASTDGGESFSESTTGLPTNLTVASLIIHGTDLYAGSSLISTAKGVYRSTDNGANWAITSLATTNTINGLSRNSIGVFASTTLNGVHRSTDNGASWTKVNPGSSTNFVTSLLATNSNLYIGLGGLMYKADQSGNNWDSIRTGLPQANAGTSIYAIAASGASILCGYSSKGIYRTTNGGTNWFRSHEGLKALKVDGIHSSNGYLFAAGDQYGYFRSSDHGDTWVEINNGVSPTAGWFCFARVGSDLLAGAGAGLLYRSADNGDNWTPSNTGFGLTNSFAFVVEGSTVYTTGYAGIAKSTDAGMNWTTLPSGYLFYEAGLDIWKDGSNILTGTNVASHRSTDNGTSWSATSGVVGAFAQVDSTLFSGSSAGVKKSTDHGATWAATASLPVGAGVQSLAARGGDLFVGTSDGVFRSTDRGGTWAAINQGLPSRITIYKLTMDDQYLYAGTVNRSVWRRPLSEVTDVREMHTGSPREFSLSQNFPNPFNPTTNIEFRISNYGFVTLEIFDLLGRTVATLVNQELHPGTYQAKWEAGKHPSAVYYYQMQAGSFSETRKLMLVR